MEEYLINIGADMKKKARDFAIRAHGDQMYGSLPYTAHLDAVAMIVKEYGEAAEVIAYLHDVVEDTDVGIDEIASEFGAFVSDCVAIVTDEPGKSRKERKIKTYRKMARVSGEEELALLVKAADRLANVRSCMAGGNARLMATYRSEFPVFKESAYREQLCDEIWSELHKIHNS
ncbi:HD domain-containing protein [Neptunomonas sp.]|uniref:HD domain-containing protein n=2 Tax=Neptunomonas sp. TaxID=1971898 RepID=UPI003564747E